MPSCLVHTGDESVTLSAATVKRLLDRGDGDAALLYLALLRRQGTVPPRSLAGELRWDRGRIEAAETALRELGLVAPAETPPAPAEERPVYQRADVAERLEHSKAFQALTRQVEVKLGKKLTTPDPAGTDGLSGPAGGRGLSAGVPLCRAGAAPIRRGPPPRHEADRKGGLRLGPHGDRHPGGGGCLSPDLRPAPGGPAPVYEGAAAGGPAPRAFGGEVSSPGRRWALARRPWPWPMTKRC